MNEELEQAPDNPAGASVLMAALASSEQAQRALYTACHPLPSLPSENALRQAEALRAAAMGLPPAGCAEAAGIPERLLERWRADLPAFDTAMRAAQHLAEQHHLTETKINPVKLGVMLQAIRYGMGVRDAEALIGFPRSVFQRLRRDNPSVRHLVTAAQGFRNRVAASRAAGRRSHTFTYRLVRRDGDV
ncbi:hypothetical protein OG741_23100 [Streptomyces sp. NBC_01410]|uniref:hypothetical protein n=1 Tax=Streptomyces sp. NBC_01410 TaxID=2903856 RepID=UPI00324C2238